MAALIRFIESSCVGGQYSKKDPMNENREACPGNDVHKVVLLSRHGADGDSSSPKKKRKKIFSLLLKKKKASEVSRSNMKAWKAILWCVYSSEPSEESIGPGVDVSRKWKLLAWKGDRPLVENKVRHDVRSKESVEVSIQILTLFGNEVNGEIQDVLAHINPHASWEKRD